MEHALDPQGIFSIAVAAFLLMRMEKKLSALTEAINRLSHCPTCKISPWHISLKDEEEVSPDEV